MNLIMTLAIAYHNTGTECEFMNTFDQAIDNFKQGYYLCKKNFGEDDSMTQNLKNCWKQAI